MKKLILVTLLAVAASWLLSEAGPRSGPETSTTVVVPPPPAPRPPAPPEWSTLVRARKVVEHARARRTATAPANPVPDWFPKTEAEEEAKARPDAAGSRVVVGRLSASEDRARLDLRKALEREVADWLAADVPTSWKAPGPAVDAMVRGTYVQPVTRSFRPAPGEQLAPDETTPDVPALDELYALYRAGQKVDFSPARRAGIVELYRQDLAAGRMRRLGGALAVALACLAVLTGYIRADEATKGYYTNRLRLAAAAGLGAAGVAAYRMLS